MSQEHDVTQIQDAVRKTYAAVACSAASQFSYPMGRAGAVALGYELSLVGDLPEEVLEAFCGVANPLSLGPINPGESALDVGCGAGFDLIFASRLVGRRGRVGGIDLTVAMVEKAQANLRRAGVPNGEVHRAACEAIPYADGTFDLVISNGVLNLSPLKEKSFEEIYRVIKSNGRLQFADTVLEEDLPTEVAGSLEAWSD